ncbi:MAG: dihydrolipoyllysine succinyltransferase [Myxococcales bacterium]|nr:dihydrolipoyllysine succinyltransferase [Myxococcales bacterium]
MADKVIMPQLGESIAEGTIVKWLKAPGESVKKDEDLLVISTDKVEAEIPAPSDGVLLTIDVPEGETVNVGTTLGYVGAEGEATPSGGDAAPAAEAAPEPEPQPEPAAPPAPEPAVTLEPPPAPPAPAASGNTFISPLVRKIAAENGISDAEIFTIPGTGNNGRVTKKDLKKYIAAKAAGTVSTPAPAAAAAPAPTPAPAPAAAPAPAPAAPAVVIPQGERELVQPMSTMRRVISENMVASKATSPHVTTFFDVDYTAIDAVRNQFKAAFKAEEGVSLTYTTFLAYGVCQALKRHPYVNAEIRDGNVVFKKDVHLGIAVALSDPEPGLMVPVIRNADQMNLRGIAHAIADLALRARTKKIKPNELSGGTFTITNPGNYGAIIGTPIINQPQVAILGVGRIQKEPVVLDVQGTDAIGIRKMGVMSLSFDHRLVDGATADLFMADVKKTLETWNVNP